MSESSPYLCDISANSLVLCGYSVKSAEAIQYWLNVGLLPVGEIILIDNPYQPANGWFFSRRF